ncbi:hypothetical protein GCM10022254_44790 [Actinomadura meridiana]|uniref:4'-phosphopantetheinyl transferase domain-containing protein n=1 Tax=Actinomadura meridiana TaxID=559626 RepID=A0ABP8C9G8_9ACTN
MDLVPFARVQTMIDTADGRSLRLMLTPAEQELSRFPTGWDVDGVAGRLAAKEAVFKLLRVGGRPLPWPSIEILKDSGNRPYVRLTGQAARWAADDGLEAIDISISHDGQFAIAVAAGTTRHSVHPNPIPKEVSHGDHDLARP